MDKITNKQTNKQTIEQEKSHGMTLLLDGS
jgi:hypothetical protein